LSPKTALSVYNIPLGMVRSRKSCVARESQLPCCQNQWC